MWCGAVAAELRGGPWRDEPNDYRCGAVIVVAGEFLAGGGLVAFGVPPVTRLGVWLSNSIVDGFSVHNQEPLSCWCDIRTIAGYPMI